MNELEYNPDLFLRFNARKGTEVHAEGRVVAVRSVSLDHVMTSRKPILVTATGSDGVMILRPKDTLKYISSKKVEGSNYSIMFFPWEPVSQKVLHEVNHCYFLRKEMDKLIEEALNPKKDGVKN